MTPATSATQATRETTRATRPILVTTAARSLIHDRDAGPGAVGALALTLDPVAEEGFFADHWERRPLVIPRGERDRFTALLSVADIDRLVCETGIRMQAFRMVRDGTPLPPSDYTDDINWRPGSFSQTASVERVAAEFAAGATLVLQALHLNWPAVAL